MGSPRSGRVYVGLEAHLSAEFGMSARGADPDACRGGMGRAKTSRAVSAVHIGLDCSTTSCKAIAWTGEGQPVAEGRAGLRTCSTAPGFAEQDARDWWRGTRAALRECVSKLRKRRVSAVGITFQRETFVLLDRERKPVGPALLWYDARAADEAAELKLTFGARRYHRRTGKQLDTTSAVAKLLWLKRNSREILDRTAHFADVLAYLSCAMTGTLNTTYAGVDTTGLISLKTAGWYGGSVRASGLGASALPGIVPPGTSLGALSLRAARATGLQPGTAVVAGGGDGHCFALGAGQLDCDCATLSLGTSAVLGVLAPEPVIGTEFRTLLACAPGMYVLESVIQCGSATLGWLRDRFLPTGSRVSMSQLEREAAVIPAGCDGLLVVPYWRGRRVPTEDPHARGIAVGWSDRHTVAHFYRAVIEGIAMEIRALLTRIEGRTGRKTRRLVVGGGGAASDAWCQVFALTGARVTNTSGPEPFSVSISKEPALSRPMVVFHRNGALLWVRCQ